MRNFTTCRGDPGAKTVRAASVGSLGPTTLVKTAGEGVVGPQIIKIFPAAVRTKRSDGRKAVSFSPVSV